MNIKEVKDLIQDILQSDISEFELEHTGTKVRLRRGVLQGEAAASMAAQGPPRPAAEWREMPAHLALSALPGSGLKPEAGPEEGLHIITSPIVGTFYRAPSPGADPYIKTGSKVEVGSILCIVEAMKLMNEIPSDVSGEVVEIHAENGHPVEYGQKLVSIRPRK